MNYDKELIERIKDSAKWPDFDRPDFLEKLSDLADESFKSGTVEGYLAALLIYQQLAEEMMKLFLKDHEFFVQLSVFPAEIKFRSKSKTMFGRIIDELKNTVALGDEKLQIIALAEEINRIRIELVHGLTKLSDLKEVKDMVAHARRVFDQLHEKFHSEHDRFRLCFKDFKKDVDWDEYLDE